MPLKIAQVMQSETFGLSTGDEFKAAFALWCASWMEVPAASLPNDDRMLDFLSRSKVWKKVKVVAMRGWVLCADGRLYHPVIAANALEAWEKRTEWRDKEDSKNERQQRWRDQCKQLAAQLRDIGVTPPKGASLETLKRLLDEHGVDVEASTGVDGEASTVDAGEIAKTETVKGQGQGLEEPPIPPEGGKPSRRKPTVALQTFLDECKAEGRKPIPEGASVFAYAEQSGIPPAFLRLQWLEFKDRYADGSKRYKDWAGVFSKSVRGNWFKLWFADRADGDDAATYKLTTTGIQAENTHRGKK